MSEQTHVRIRFRGATYAVTRKHAAVLARRKHLRRDILGALVMDDDRCIEVIGEPIKEPSSDRTEK